MKGMIKTTYNGPAKAKPAAIDADNRIDFTHDPALPWETVLRNAVRVQMQGTCIGEAWRGYEYLYEITYRSIYGVRTSRLFFVDLDGDAD